MSSGRRVILTRPSSENQAWTHGLEAAGHQVRSWPLIAISASPHHQQLAASLAAALPYQALMFVSRHAIKHGLAAFGAAVDWDRTRCWVTGPGSRQAAIEAGVPAQAIDAPDEAAAQYDTEALWQVVQPTLKANQAVVIVRGSQADQADTAMQGVGRDWLAQQLKAAGIEVHPLAAYQRQSVVWSAAQQAQARLAASDGSVWVFSSAQALANLHTLLPAQDWAKAMALTTHARIAQAATDMGFGEVQICKPVLSALLASLESRHEQ